VVASAALRLLRRRFYQPRGVNRVNAPVPREVGRVERQQLLDAVNEQERGEACVVDSFAGDLAALYEFQPALQDIRGVIQQWELVSQGADYVSRGFGRPAKTVGAFRTSRDGPEFHKDLRADGQVVIACQQVFYGCCGYSIALDCGRLRIEGVRSYR
jgi:hypothetical protein